MSESPPSTDKLYLSSLSPQEMAEALHLKPFQGRQLFRWIHQKREFDVERMTDLSKSVRNGLGRSCVTRQLHPVETLHSPESGTVKILFRLGDGQTIESVLLRHGRRVTLCLSTQVGCPVRCAFCATGTSGFRRNLTAGEIVEQALHLLEGQDIGERTPNIVYMGMGEPFLNYDATVKSIRLLMAPEGLGIGARKITVSTAGHVPGIYQFAQEGWQVRLSVSLHAANDTLRSSLVPMNHKYPLHTLLDALKYYVATTGRQITLEWVLLDGVNDSPEDADELALWLEKLKAAVNLIPYNTVSDFDYTPSPRAVCERFRDALLKHSVAATLRQERGQDIEAACGQLRLRNHP